MPTTAGRSSWLTEPPMVIANSRELHDKASARLSDLGTFPPAVRLLPNVQPLPSSCDGAYLARDNGLQRMALHAAAWERIVERNTSAAIFEPDFAYASAAHASARLRDLAQPRKAAVSGSSSASSGCDVILLGHCAGDAIFARARCTHAYVVSPRAASLLLGLLRERRGCALPGELHRALCGGLPGEQTMARPPSGLCCAAVKGSPGKLLYGTGLIGKERTMPGVVLTAAAAAGSASSSSAAAASSSSASSSSSSVWMPAAPMIVAFDSRFDRAAAVVRSLGLFPSAVRLHPADPPTQCPIMDARAGGEGGIGSGGIGSGGTGSSSGGASSSTTTASSNIVSDSFGGALPALHAAPLHAAPLHAAPLHAAPRRVLTRGILSLAATHAEAWRRIVASNLTSAVFEDDVAVDHPRRARVRLLELVRDAPCDFVQLGHCGSRGTRCTHAYVATPRAAAALLVSYRRASGCVQSDDPQEEFCNRADACCAVAKGIPGAQLYGSGIIGQNRSLPHYLHFRPCWKIKHAARAAHGCASVMDYETAPDGTTLRDA